MEGDQGLQIRPNLFSFWVGVAYGWMSLALLGATVSRSGISGLSLAVFGARWSSEQGAVLVPVKLILARWSTVVKKSRPGPTEPRKRGPRVLTTAGTMPVLQEEGQIWMRSPAESRRVDA